MALHDVDYQTMLPLQAVGQYGLQVTDPERFMIKMVGTKDVFTESDMLSQAYGEFATKTKSVIVQFMTNQRIGFKSVSAHLDGLSQHNNQPTFGGQAGYQPNMQGGQSGSGVREIYCANCSKKHLTTERFCPHCGSEYHPCPNCGTDNPLNARRCVSCGTSLQQNAMGTQCPSCGAPLTPGTMFCPQCGARQASVTTGNVCPRCGASVPVTSHFCPKCGQKI